ncbi:MAG: recombinase RecT, partial [Desulfovibrionaceae bacterium]|nr:recombinase RecT [Desulfovibrionaceae bacterium]
MAYNNVALYSGAEARQKGANAPAQLNTVTHLLSLQFKAIKSALPKHMTPERMCRVALNTIRRTPALLDCAPETLVAAIVEASSLGLEIDMRGQAYLVPFQNKKTGRREVQLIPGYKGLADLAFRSGRVSSIFAEVVCENDKFKFSLGLEPVLEHTPNLEDRGRLLAVYAVARMKDADPQFVVMGRADVERIKKASKASTSGPWSDWEEEMWKKTAIRRLCKLLPLSPEMQRAVAIDEYAEAGIPQGLGETVLDIAPTPQTEPAPNAESIEEAEPEPTPAPEPALITCPDSG